MLGWGSKGSKSSDTMAKTTSDIVYWVQADIGRYSGLPRVVKSSRDVNVTCKKFGTKTKVVNFSPWQACTAWEREREYVVTNQNRYILLEYLNPVAMLVMCLCCPDIHMSFRKIDSISADHRKSELSSACRRGLRIRVIQKVNRSTKAAQED